MRDTTATTLRSPYEVFAKAPNQLTTIAHTQNGDATTVFDGKQGWVASVENRSSVALPSRPGTGRRQMDADLWFPGGIKQALTNWRTGFPETAIEDLEVNVDPGNWRRQVTF